MKKLVAIVMAVCMMLVVLSGCSTKSFKRISFDGETLGDELDKYIANDTSVRNLAEGETFPSVLPVYKITERKITEEEFQQTLDNLGIAESAGHKELDGNSFSIQLETPLGITPMTMTEEEVIERAKEVFNKLTFMDGEYECTGVKMVDYTKVHDKATDQDVTYIEEVGVAFCRVLDGITVAGGGRCFIRFWEGGLSGINVKCYNYEKVGTVELIKPELASARIKSPDSLSVVSKFDLSNPAKLSEYYGELETIRVENAQILYQNQYEVGCEILQPVYSFYGSATDIDGKEAEFVSKIIAIPESPTYKKISFRSDD